MLSPSLTPNFLAAHIVYGIPQTMNAGNYACAKVYADVKKLYPFLTAKTPRLEDILTGEWVKSSAARCSQMPAWKK